MENNESNQGLQSRKWDGYFDEDTDSIMGNWHRCMVCNKIPCEIYRDTQKLFTIWHCLTCKEEDYKPKNILQGILIFIDRKHNK